MWVKWPRFIIAIVLIVIIVLLKRFEMPMMFSGIFLCCSLCCLATSLKPGDRPSSFINIEEFYSDDKSD